MNKEETLARAKALRQEDELEDSQELLLRLLEEYPDDPAVLFEAGGSFDVLGMEPEAIPYYQKAIEKGLDGEALQECLVCLGSSLRYTGQVDEAIAVLERAVEAYPERQSGRVFLALAQYSDGQYEEAVRTLLQVILAEVQDEELQAYAGALAYYKDNLDETYQED